eukprot:COSAG01_NODE_52747_length_344_cov_1.187755_1_plen_86_part_10
MERQGVAVGARPWPKGFSSCDRGGARPRTRTRTWTPSSCSSCDSSCLPLHHWPDLCLRLAETFNTKLGLLNGHRCAARCTKGIAGQ